jgi:hypothetical protein
MVALVSSHGAIGAVIPWRAYHLTFQLTDPLMWLIVPRKNRYRVNRGFRTIISSRAYHALTLIFKSRAVSTESPRRAWPLPRVGAEGTEVAFRTSLPLVLSCHIALTSHGAELAVCDGSPKELIIVGSSWAFLRYLGIDRAKVPPRTRIQLVVLGASQAVIAGRAYRASLILALGSLDYAEHAT